MFFNPIQGTDLLLWMRIFSVTNLAWGYSFAKKTHYFDKLLLVSIVCSQKTFHLFISLSFKKHVCS